MSFQSRNPAGDVVRHLDSKSLIKTAKMTELSPVLVNRRRGLELGPYSWLALCHLAAIQGAWMKPTSHQQSSEIS